MTVKNTHTRLKTTALNFWEVLAQAIAFDFPEHDDRSDRAPDVRHGGRGDQKGFLQNDWIGNQIAIGPEVLMHITVPVPAV